MNGDNIKAALADRAEEFVRWLLPAGRKNGVNWRVGSISGEAGQSLGVCVSGAKVGVFSDFEKGTGGSNLVELFSQVRQVPYLEARAACAEWLGVRGVSLDATPSRAVVPRPTLGTQQRMCRAQFPSEIYTASDDESASALRMAEALSSNPVVCAGVAKTRGWKPETLRQLALEGYLGWDDGKLAFIYDTGVKLRSRKETGERVIWWAFGKPWLWRGAWIEFAETIYLCEGETDCIALIDAGIESEQGTVAVAVPSASTFDERWAQLFKQKNVILAFDDDAAGRAATRKLSEVLAPLVKSLQRLNWEGAEYVAS